MPTKEELEQAIHNLENMEPCYEVCQKLVIYHKLHDMYYGGRITTYSSDSEFMQASEDTEIDKLYSVFDELMECLKLINPKLYDSVILKLKTA